MMKHQYWKNRWEENDVAWHLPMAHPLLIQMQAQLGLRQGDAVFVPLCGASIDMLYLAEQGYFVIGNELSPLACQQFFESNGLSYTKTQQGDFELYEGNNIFLYCGDFFKLAPALFTKKISAIYDRAALIALPEDLRQLYVKKLNTLFPTGADILLITIEYKNERNVPPYLVESEELNSLYGDSHTLKPLGRFGDTLMCQRLGERGFVEPCEVVYLLQGGERLIKE